MTFTDYFPCLFSFAFAITTVKVGWCHCFPDLEILLEAGFVVVVACDGKIVKKTFRTHAPAERLHPYRQYLWQIDVLYLMTTRASLSVFLTTRACLSVFLIKSLRLTSDFVVHLDDVSGLFQRVDDPVRLDLARQLHLAHWRMETTVKQRNETK